MKYYREKSLRLILHLSKTFLIRGQPSSKLVIMSFVSARHQAFVCFLIRNNCYRRRQIIQLQHLGQGKVYYLLMVNEWEPTIKFYLTEISFTAGLNNLFLYSSYHKLDYSCDVEMSHQYWIVQLNASPKPAVIQSQYLFMCNRINRL